jgi:hypothetical protein
MRAWRLGKRARTSDGSESMRRPHRRSLFGLGLFVIVAIVVFAVASAGAFAGKQPMTIAVTPTSTTAGSTGNAFTFKVTTSAATSGQLSIVVPAGWTAPQASNSTLPGYVVIQKLTCASAGPFPTSITGSGPWTIKIPYSCATNKNFSMAYGGTVAPSKVTAPTSPGFYEFTSEADFGSGFQRLASQPVVSVTAPSVHLAVSGLPNTVAAGASNSFTVSARDSKNNVVTKYLGTVHLTSSDPVATLPADYTFTAGDVGTHTFTPGATFVSTGSRTLTATDTTNAAINGSQTVTVGPGAATHFAVSGLANPSTAGVAQSVNVTAKDAFNNTATGYTGTVHFTSSDGTATLPANYGFTGADAGSHTFSATLRTLGSQDVTATDTANASVSGLQTVTVNPGAATHFLVSGPASATAGASFSVTVTAKDSSNNTATGYTGTVHFTKSDSGAGSALPANYTFTAADAGAQTFPNSVTFVTVGSQSLTATDTSNSSINGSQSVSVNAGLATRLVVTGLSGKTAGTAQDVTVTAEDTFNNVATGYTGTIHFTSTDGAATVPADYTFVGADAGAHAFSGGVTLATAGSQTVTARDTVTSSITGSQTVAVSAGPLASLVVSPGSATIESPTLPPPPPFMDQTESSPYPPYAAFSAEGFDAHGNDLGDETANATFSIPAVYGGDCVQNVCGFVTLGGSFQVTATFASAEGTAMMNTDHGPLSYSCQGEHYDVNNNAADGCEHQQPLAAHDQSSASSLGSLDCIDANTLTASGVLYSDSRIHQNPSVVGFDGSVGSAPEWYSVNATGGFFCIDDYSVTFTTSGGSNIAPCYKVTMITNKLTDSRTVSGSGTATMLGGSASYSDNTTVYFEVEKTCNLPTQEATNYTFTFHL